MAEIKDKVVTLESLKYVHDSLDGTKVPITRTVNGKELSVDISITADDVGAEAIGTVSIHDAATNSHSDIRNLITGLTLRLNTLADSDDATLDQMSELVAYIKSNKDLIEEITTKKVNVSDIIDDLTTSTPAKPLSAAQGVALKGLIDALDNDKIDSSSLELAINAALANTVDKRKITLGLYTDGLIYLFIDGLPVGNGIALPSGGVSGDVVGNVDSANNIVLMGNLADGTYTVKYEMEDGSTINIGTMMLDSNVYYAITKNLTNCSISNSATSIIEGESYSATISANNGYELKSVSVTMGGSPVTVSGGVINISNVTGNIVIAAVAEEVQAAEPVTVDIALTDGIRIGSGGGDRTQAGYCATPHIDLTNIPKPCTIHLTKAKWLVFDGENNTMIRVYAKKADGTQLITDVAKEGIGGSYFTIVDNSDIGNDVIVTITSNDVGYIRFSGQWSFTGASDSNSSFVAANTKATLTYTPIEGGGSDEPTTQTYTITSNLTNCTSNNSATTVDEGSAYNATITADDGYELKSVTATMGGSAVSVSGGVINIASVTGDIIITAIAEEKVVGVEPTNFFNSSESPAAAGRIGSDGNNRTDASLNYTTNYIPVKAGDIVVVSGCDISGIASGTNTYYMASYNSSKTKLFAGQPDASNVYHTLDSMTENNAQITVVGDTVAYLRFTCSNPKGSNIQVDTSAIVINVKRNGEWL